MVIPTVTDMVGVPRIEPSISSVPAVIYLVGVLGIEPSVSASRTQRVANTLHSEKYGGQAERGALPLRYTPAHSRQAGEACILPLNHTPIIRDKIIANDRQVIYRCNTHWKS